MGVFPLADTMIRFSNVPWSRGGMHAGANGWTNEVWWYAHRTTTPRRDATAVHSPTDSLIPTDVTVWCSGTAPRPRPLPARDPAARRGSYVSDRPGSPRIGSRHSIAVKQ